MVFRVGLDFKSTEEKLLWQTSCCCWQSMLLWKEPWNEVEMPCSKGKSGPSLGNYQECSLGRFSTVSARWQRGTGCSESGKTQGWAGGSQKGLWEQRTSQGLKGSWQSLLPLAKPPAEIRSVGKNLPPQTQQAEEQAQINPFYLLLICSERLLFKTLSILVLILI